MTLQVEGRMPREEHHDLPDVSIHDQLPGAPLDTRLRQQLTANQGMDLYTVTDLSHPDQVKIPSNS